MKSLDNTSLKNFKNVNRTLSILLSLLHGMMEAEHTTKIKCLVLNLNQKTTVSKLKNQ